MDVRNIAVSMHNSGGLAIEIDPDQRISKILLPHEGITIEQEKNGPIEKQV
tara:strand:- start:344 stop:496 length:153 start_codon:yes stop_codon:yes gene_type:complete